MVANCFEFALILAASRGIREIVVVVRLCHEKHGYVFRFLALCVKLVKVLKLVSYLPASLWSEHKSSYKWPVEPRRVVQE